MRKAAAERFLAGIRKDESTGCWFWHSSGPSTTYPRMMVNGKSVSVHRFSYTFHKGPIPDGLCVCHSCDVRGCVNPSHLWAGTSLENTRDMIAKGRAPHPADRKPSKRSLHLRSAFMAAINKDDSLARHQLARKLGVSVATVNGVARVLGYKFYRIGQWEDVSQC